MTGNPSAVILLHPFLGPSSFSFHESFLFYYSFLFFFFSVFLLLSDLRARPSASLSTRCHHARRLPLNKIQNKILLASLWSVRPRPLASCHSEGQVQRAGFEFQTNLSGLGMQLRRRTPMSMQRKVMACSRNPPNINITQRHDCPRPLIGLVVWGPIVPSVRALTSTLLTQAVAFEFASALQVYSRCSVVQCIPAYLQPSSAV
ncbi:uncharacterized protein BO72DRAFT_83155 [Aspergillus fijiensis CBS 313.89]|uniref:Uncharacterized protein n=1 Tax=Aspergillus fijiensis CBS 313.89 TaxID=1448319 RepID=A0A8G1W056_9EURO|nr:uncharacterized protein BO72DRAFT_83155 [Aspergillus fijiensis CBS 313.89]RAK77986.1 hypothetical protein BO72DRAFT_83155 [Aspergillus fijiensis CBS 313.89]